MYSLVNLNMKVERELELEREGFRRTRRWIGDANQVKDLRWYRREMRRISGTDKDQAEVNQMTKNQSLPQVITSFLSRIFNLPSTRQQTVRSKS
jgi:hypothetical protein